MSTLSSWIENSRSMVIFQRLENICLEEGIPQKGFSFRSLWQLITSTYKKKTISENVPLSVVLVGVELRGKDEGDIHQKGSCSSPIEEGTCWRSSRLCGRPWRKRSMYLREQSSMLVMSRGSNSDLKEPLTSFYIFKSSHHSYHGNVMSSHFSHSATFHFKKKLQFCLKR